MTKMLQQKNG